MNGIRHITLKASELKELQAIMSKGNTLLKECAKMMDMTGGEFRGKLFDRKLDTSKLSAEQHQKLIDAIPFIMEVRNKCEHKILSGFIKMVYKQAKAAASNSTDSKNAMLDFEQEGMLGVLECIYGYTDTKIQFITYAWRVVRRHINRNINKLNPFCPLTNEAMALVQDFDKTKTGMQLKTNCFVNSEEVIAAMGLTNEQKDVLFSANTKMISEFQDRDNDHNSGDYTSQRRGIDNDLHEVNVIRKDARQAIKDADLTNVELNVLLADMFPYIGWREDVASKFINPNSGKRYTRANIVNILERAKKKVREVYLFPSDSPKESQMVDQIFDEMSGKLAT
jgi:DNA-directed RNA polymerase sigma subunit (sigma70/sigma32)